jgi:anti-anti-sigma regulatory factor
MPLNSSVCENGDIVITSGDRLTIENSADFSRIIREALETSRSVALSFEPTLAIDITGMQILCSACKSAAQNGTTFSCSSPLPQALIDLIAACGAERHAACKHNNDSSCSWFGGGN